MLGLTRTAEARLGAQIARSTRLVSEGRAIKVAKDRSRISIGANGRVRGEMLVCAHAGRIRVGAWLYLGSGSGVWSSEAEGITIGDRVLISQKVIIDDTNSHALDAAQRLLHTQELFTKGHPTSNPGIRAAPIRIGNDVWIGFGATIIKGTSIGGRAVIGAFAIVDKDVPADGIVRVSRRHAHNSSQE